MSEKKVGKRLLTWVLVLVMALSLLPLNVLADYVPYDSSEGESNSWVTKTAEWVDAKAGIAQITIRVQGDASSTSSTITPTDIVLVIDTSGSMGEGSGKMYNAKAAAKAFVDKFFGSDASAAAKGNVRIGIVPYASDVSYTTGLTNDKDTLDLAIDSLHANGGTNIQAAISSAQAMLDGGRPNAAKVMVVLTDGEPTYSYKGSTATSIVGDTETYGVNASNFSYIVSDFDFDNRIGVGRYYQIYIPYHVSDGNDRHEVDNHGVGTVSQAYAAKRAGTVIYGIGYGIGDQENAYDVMNSVASAGKYYGASESDNSINDIFDSIANDITTFAAYNAVLTDTMGDGFTVLNDGPYQLDDNIQLINNGTVYWEVADELDDQEHEITFYVQYDTEGELSDRAYLPTNKEARLDYDTDKSGTSSGSVTANVPEVENHAHFVTYDYADGSTPSDKQLYWLGKNITVVENDPTRTGYTFTGWTVNGYTFAEGPKAGDVFPMPGNDVIFTANWVKDESQTQKTSYTVKYTIEGTEQVKDRVIVPGTAWINDNPAKIAIAEGGIPAPANKYAGYKLDPNNPTYPAAGTEVDSGSVYTVNYVKDSFEYKVEYYYNGKIDNSKTETKSAEFGSEIKTYTGKAITGYKLDKTENLPLTVSADSSKNIIKVYYVKKSTNHPSTPSKPTVVIPDDDALGLNTTDHFAYIVGYGNGEVRPQNNITRAEVATIFFRLLTDDVRDENLTKTNRYSDVAATAWYNTAVSTLSSMGIITGYPDGTFRPNAAITRAEFAAIAARFDHDGDKTAAKFSDIATHWAKDEISIAYNNGWITGYPDGTFGPQRDITRAETMTLVNRVLNRQPETEDDLLPNMTVWTGNANPKAWYYLAVQEATNSHYYKFKTNSKYEKWTELRETRDWTLLEK